MVRLLAVVFLILQAFHIPILDILQKSIFSAAPGGEDATDDGDEIIYARTLLFEHAHSNLSLIGPISSRQKNHPG